MSRPGVVHGLSFDVEEYFHALNLRPVAPVERWEEMPRRSVEQTLRLLDLLAEHEVRATFFFLGWVARRSPELVRRVRDGGHEVASHGMSHRMAGELGPEAFRAEARESRALLEDASGGAVVGFRASTFSITSATSWAFQVLLEEGYRYDSSVFPIRHDRYGWPGFATGPCRVDTAAGAILELPLLTLPVFGLRWPAAGGGYLRLLPAWPMHRALSRAASRGTPGVVYLHPWEFDPDQPRLLRGGVRAVRHYGGMRALRAKLERLLRRHRFGRLDAVAAAVARGDVETTRREIRADGAQGSASSESTRGRKG